MQTFYFTPPVPSPKVPILFGQHLLEHPLFLEICKGKRIALLIEETLAPLHAEKTLQTLSAELLLLKGGEANKSREEKERIENLLLEKNFGKDTVLIALGGGVTLDIAGFIAATYLRGVPIVYMPTTLLAMVDAAIGGKTGVNTPYGKNMIGAFYFPKAVLIDPTFLSTLPKQEWMNGLAEILKYGLIADSKLFESMEKHPSDWQTEPWIEASIRIKMQIVEEDPLETKGVRNILNFGHTVGHALEALSNYQLPHGHAVAIGCLAESLLSHAQGFLSKQDLTRIFRLYEKIGYSLDFPFERARFLEQITHDKKAKSGQARFVLLERIGRTMPFHGTYCQRIDPTDLAPMLEWLEKKTFSI